MPPQWLNSNTPRGRSWTLFADKLLTLIAYRQHQFDVMPSWSMAMLIINSISHYNKNGNIILMKGIRIQWLWDTQGNWGAGQRYELFVGWLPNVPETC